MVDTARRMFQRLVSALDSEIDRLSDQAAVEPDAKLVRDLTTQVREVHRALMIVLEHENRLQAQDPGPAGDALDLEAARAEIESRMARLRARGGAEGASEHA